MRARWLAGLVLAVLLAHTSGLWWVNAQMLARSGLELLAQPVFARTIDLEPPPALVAVPAPQPKATAAAGVATSLSQSSTKTVAAEPSKPERKVEREPVPNEVEATKAGPKAEASLATPASDDAALAEEERKRSLAETLIASTADKPVAPSVVDRSALPAAVPRDGAPATVALEDWPTDTRLSYRVEGSYRGEVQGKANVTWIRQGEKYEVRLAIDLGLVDLTMTSQGIIKNGHLWPQVYEERLPNGKRRTLKLGDQFLTLGDGSSVPRPNGAQDTVSQFVELMHRYRNGLDTLRSGGVVLMPLARPGGTNDWVFDVQEDANFPTRVNETYREISAFHLKPRPVVNARGPIAMELWLAPQLQFFPARVRVNVSADVWLVLDVSEIQQR